MLPDRAPLIAARRFGLQVSETDTTFTIKLKVLVGGKLPFIYQVGGRSGAGLRAHCSAGCSAAQQCHLRCRQVRMPCSSRCDRGSAPPARPPTRPPTPACQESFAKDSSPSTWMLRRDLAPGRTVGQMFYTECGKVGGASSQRLSCRWMAA